MFKDKLEKIKEILQILEKSVLDKYLWIVKIFSYIVIWVYKNFVYIAIVFFGSSIMIIGIEEWINEQFKKQECNRLGKYNKIRRM